MAQDRKEYFKSYYQAHKEEKNARSRAWNQAHKEYLKSYNQAHKEEKKARRKDYYQAHKEEENARSKAWNQAHKEEKKEYSKAYNKADVNSLGQPKLNIRNKSKRYLNKYGTKIPGYEIHHCCTYTEPYKFIYCSKEMHLKIHQYLRDNNIDADSNHYDLIKHLLDDTVVLYGV